MNLIKNVGRFSQRLQQKAFIMYFSFTLIPCTEGITNDHSDYQPRFITATKTTTAVSLR